MSKLLIGKISWSLRKQRLFKKMHEYYCHDLVLNVILCWQNGGYFSDRSKSIKYMISSKSAAAAASVYNHKYSSWEKHAWNSFSSKLKLSGCFCFLPQVQSHLENSKFHLHQTQNQQVKQYFTLGSKLASSGGQGHAVPHPHAPGQALATVPIMRNGHVAPVSDSSNPNSPVTLLTMTSHDSEVSGQETRKTLSVAEEYKTETERSKNVSCWREKNAKIETTDRSLAVNQWLRFFLLILSFSLIVNAVRRRAQSQPTACLDVQSRSWVEFSGVEFILDLNLKESSKQSQVIIDRSVSLMCSSITSNIQSLMRELFQRRKLIIVAWPMLSN